MSQFPHDEFVKEYLPELISDYGDVTSGENVTGQRREIDVFFQPNKPVPTTPDTLGLLGKLTQTTCLFEVFRNPVTTSEIKECLGKLFDVEVAIKREKRRNKSKENTQEKPFLWILTPTLSEEKLNSFKAELSESWCPGIYFLPPAFNTAIIVIHQLPVNKETLWLRILGKGKVQENAIDEIKALPKNHPNRDNVLELIGNLFAILEANRKKGNKLEQEDRELIMKLSPIYMERLAESKQEGRQEEASQLILKQLQRKVGSLSPQIQQQIENLSLEKLEALGEALLDFNSLDNLIDWLTHNIDF